MQKIRDITYALSTNFNAYSISDLYQHKDVVYAFSGKDLQMKETYIGITQNVGNRLNTHLLVSKQDSSHIRLLYGHLHYKGLDNINFHILLSLDKFSSMFTKEYGYITPELSYILKSFSEYRIYEQALFSYYKPGLNTSYTTQFNFLNWKPGYSAKEIPAYITSPDFLKHKELFLANKVPGTLDFTLYKNLCTHYNMVPADDSWLEWFTGFIEERGIFNKYYKKNAITIQISNESALKEIRDTLQLTTDIKLRTESGSYAIMITGNYNMEIIGSILYNNIASFNTLEGFNSHISSIFTHLGDSKAEPSIISLDGYQVTLIVLGVFFMIKVSITHHGLK